MATPIIEIGNAVRVTATGDIGIAGQNLALLGFFVSSTTSGTLVLRRGGSGGTQISGTITPAAGAFYPFPAACTGGLHATIANTLDVTFFFAPENG